MEQPNDPLFWVISEAIQQLGVGTDAKVLTERIKRLQVGLPAEDEFSVLITWLGQCRLVHKLDQLQSPQSSRIQWQVPDLLAVFEYHGHELPVLIEVKTSSFGNNKLDWSPAYRNRLVKYAELLKMPLLVAWRFGTFWALFDVHQLTPSPIRYKIKFLDALKHTLMTEIAGDFSFSLRAGCGIHFRIRKFHETRDGGFEGIIEEAYWTDASGARVNDAPGVFPLFTCLEQESIISEDGEFITQSFVISDGRIAQFAHRALAMLLRLSMRAEDPHWRRALESKLSPPFAREGLRHAAQHAYDAGFLQESIQIRPTVLPPFLADVRRV